MPALATITGMFLAGLMTAFVFLAGSLFMAGTAVVALLYILGGGLVWLAVRQFWRMTEVFPEHRLLTGVLIPLPLLFAGMLMVFALPLLLPTLDARGVASLAGWLLFLPAIGLISAIKGAQTPQQ